MMRGGGGGKEAEEVGKVMGPLFPRLHVSDAVKGGGPRAPPRNKMALYEQFTVPSHRRFSAPASSPGASTVPSASTSQVYGSDRSLFQPFNVPSNGPGHSTEKVNSDTINRKINGSRKESGMLSSQTKGMDNYASRSTAQCAPQQRVENTINSSSGKRLADDDEFMVPSVFNSRFPQYSTQEHARVQDKPTPLEAASPHKRPSTVYKSSTKCYNTVDKHLERINVSDVKSRNPPKDNEIETTQTSQNVEIEKSSSRQPSKDMFGSRHAKVYPNMDKMGIINDSDEPHVGNSGYRAASRNGGSMKFLNPPVRTNAISSKPSFENTDKHYNLAQGGLKETGANRKRLLEQHDAEKNDDVSDSSVECITGWEISPDKIVGAIGTKHFWKARHAIMNQQRVFAVQVFELHKLVKVQKLIAASPHVLIEGDPCLGNALLGSKKKLDEENPKAQALLVVTNDDVEPSIQQPELSKENSEESPPSPPHDTGLVTGQHDQAATNGASKSNRRATPVASDNQNNWGAQLQPIQNQWLVPVMSPSEGLVYKPYSGPCPPAGSLLAPFYTSCAPLSLPSTAGDFMNSAYGVPIPHHQPQHMGAPGPPAMPMNYFPPFSIPVMNPGAPASMAEQGRHPSMPQPYGNFEQHSWISGNMSHPSGIWRFHASRDSEAQASSASSPFDRLQCGGSRPVSAAFPTASAQNTQPQPSSGSQDNQTIVIRVVPHNSRTASESAARIFRSIQRERVRDD
ncbi:protein HEADING DATE 3B-like isoform X1 [Oryza brachyantha]|uniref:protein HEADING DATE 3B-like isoform X1 n=1 Tax=Oryza brachyantha TaxID=4533 RepID=UPI001ADC1889|nr:protein HEADING DATE 3B-like isoform X1 [Oryza brachyantha]